MNTSQSAPQSTIKADIPVNPPGQAISPAYKVMPQPTLVAEFSTLPIDQTMSDNDIDIDECSSDSDEYNNNIGGVRKAGAKRRHRGAIEKRRRDRINQSLSELRRCVPAAFEKQGSQKLEKADVLAMAVTRDCASALARFLASCQTGQLANAHPLRTRLMAHLQCRAAQRRAQIEAAGDHGAHRQSRLPTAAAPVPPQPAQAQITLPTCENGRSAVAVPQMPLDQALLAALMQMQAASSLQNCVGPQTQPNTRPVGAVASLSAAASALVASMDTLAQGRQ